MWVSVCLSVVVLGLVDGECDVMLVLLSNVSVVCWFDVLVVLVFVMFVLLFVM